MTHQAILLTYILDFFQEVQTWLAEEISTVTPGAPIKDWKHQELLSRLIRCHAILLVELMCCALAMMSSKWTINNAGP